MRSTDQGRADFEAWVSTQSVVKKYGAKLHRSSCGNHYKDLRINQRWLAFKAGRAALQSQDRGDVDRIINAARSAMDQSYEAEDGVGGITIPSDAAASLSLALDEFDRARRIEGAGK